MAFSLPLSADIIEVTHLTLKMGDGRVSGVDNLEKLLKTSKSKPAHLESFHVPVGVAYAMFYSGDAARAATNASQLLKALSKG